MDTAATRCAFVRNRAAGLYGGAVHVASADAATFTDCAFDSNVAVKGGALRVKRDNTAAEGNVVIASSLFLNNVAQYGGGLLVDDNGAVTVTGSNFTANGAVAAGGGVAVGDGGRVAVAATQFVGNGNFSCVDAPAAGGALAVGLDEFKPTVGCTVSWERGGGGWWAAF